MRHRKDVALLQWEGFRHDLLFYKMIEVFDDSFGLKKGDTAIEINIGKRSIPTFNTRRPAPLLEALMQLESFQEIYTKHGDWVELK